MSGRSPGLSCLSCSRVTTLSQACLDSLSHGEARGKSTPGAFSGTWASAWSCPLLDGKDLREVVSHGQVLPAPGTRGDLPPVVGFDPYQKNVADFQRPGSYQWIRLQETQAVLFSDSRHAHRGAGRLPLTRAPCKWRDPPTCLTSTFSPFPQLAGCLPMWICPVCMFLCVR